jgi:hypothetical protein
MVGVSDKSAYKQGNLDSQKIDICAEKIISR